MRRFWILLAHSASSVFRCNARGAWFIEMININSWSCLWLYGNDRYRWNMITGSDGLVNVICHFPTHPYLQPKRIIIETWNLVWRVTKCIVFGPSRRFLINCPKAEIWGWGGGTPGGQKCQKIFFRFFWFFSTQLLSLGSFTLEYGIILVFGWFDCNI